MKGLIFYKVTRHDLNSFKRSVYILYSTTFLVELLLKKFIRKNNLSYFVSY